MIKRILFVHILLSTSFQLLSQSPKAFSDQRLSFSPFEGVVYNMPILEQKVGKLTKVSIKDYFDDSVYSYDTLTQVSYPHLQFPEKSIDHSSFPGIAQKTNYAMILESQMMVKEGGCYALELNSDDGSRLWVDGIELINNDGGHGMRIKKDTTFLSSGIYPIRVWYFQGMPDRYGLIFNSYYVGDASACIDKLVKKEIITLNSVLFHHDDYILNEKGLVEIENIAQVIKSKSPKKISIIGHTDNTGSDEYNQTLSFKRAEQVKKALKEQGVLKGLTYAVLGVGASEPKHNNDTEEGRSKNRRVEIVIE